MPKLSDYGEYYDMLGHGTYGQVFSYRHRQTHRIVAVKKIKQEHETVSPWTYREIYCLQRLKGHPYIVDLLDVCTEDDNIFLVMEALRPFYISDIRSLDDIETVFPQMITAVITCHQHGIWHRDVKPANFLWRGKRIVLADFSLATCATMPNITHSHNVVTLPYRSPELLQDSKRYDSGIDIWALGCILVEMLIEVLPEHPLRHRKLLKASTVTAQLDRIEWLNRNRMTELFPIDKSWLDLLMRMLTPNPSQRITTLALANHPALSLSLSTIPLPKPISAKASVERNTILIWLWHLCLQSAYRIETWDHMVMLYDRCQQDSFLVALICLAIASQLYELYPMIPEDISLIWKECYKDIPCPDISKSEKQVQELLAFNLLTDSAHVCSGGFRGLIERARLIDPSWVFSRSVDEAVVNYDDGILYSMVRFSVTRKRLSLILNCRIKVKHKIETLINDSS